MYNFNIPESKKIRVILDTDLKNEVDDQFAMVHAILTEFFRLKRHRSGSFWGRKVRFQSAGQL